MIRLTVMYNLAPDQDEQVFLEWRLGAHQAANQSMPGVLRTDFARVEDAWPAGTKPPYRFITTLDWPDRESFEAAFFDPDEQAALEENLKKLADPVFLISEILIHESKEDNQ